VTTILIADDQPEVREALVGLFAAEPSFRVVAVAADADEAVDLARRHRPDIALLDYKMPGGGGPRATRGIGSASRGTRVVALSAYEDSVAVLEMVRAGAVAYVVKGASGAEICETIVRAARGESTLSPEVTGDLVAELRGRLRAQAEAEDVEKTRIGRVQAALADGAMAIHLQPIVDLQSRRAIGFEALARFFVEPDRAPNVWFLEAAAVGLEEELELAAVRAAVHELARLPAGTFLAVNVSPSLLVSPALRRAIDGLPAGRLVLETTEHAAIDEYEAVEAALAAFRAAGGRLAVDDAGAGFASFRHILQLAPDFIKLDASLTRDIDLDRGRRSLAGALISFAAEIGATIIAEGIETEAELAALSLLGARFGQGYRLARPAAVETTIRANEAAGH
jgi:EAL domain-containing protein (putative c-di-GMP-specific phosphodiesterase class I)/AmiR/NasT family two-component response regulator